MPNLFDDFDSALSGDVWDERPVSLEEFVHSPQHLKMKIELSDVQYTCVRAMTQILRLETLIDLYGQKLGSEIYVQTCFEIILMLGKGSGKDFMSTIAVAYVVYQLLCMKDPAGYYGKDEGNAIDIINIAINSAQAKNVFFKGFVNLIRKAPWFAGKYVEKTDQIEFQKNVTVYSGHSEREAFEGYNTFMVILDEISGFALESTSGNEQAKTAPAIYKMYKGSVESRFSEFGKLVSLSWPRFAEDFITQIYNENVADKETLTKTVTVKINQDLPDGIEGNELDITWEEDMILRYKFNKTFALRRPTWIVNPTKKITEYAKAFADDPADAYGRHACMPSTVEGGFFKNHEKIDNAFIRFNGVDEDGIWSNAFTPKEGVTYYAHVDLAEQHDICAVAVAHVDSWVTKNIEAANYSETQPVVIIDSVRWWKPDKKTSVNFADVREYILSYRRKGFDLGLVTFDRWGSHDTMNILREQGINVDNLSLKKKHYDDFLSTMYDGRLIGPAVDEIKDELKNLMLIKGKVDHPRKGFNDRAEAMCGAINNAVENTPRPRNLVVEVRTLDDIKRERYTNVPKESNVIKAPPRTRVPDELAEFLGLARLI